MIRHSWPLEKAVETAEHFDSRSELFRHFPGCYMALKKAGRLDDLLPRIPRKKWTYSAIQSLCTRNRVETKQELALICPSASRAAYKNQTNGVRWIDALFPSHG